MPGSFATLTALLVDFGIHVANLLLTGVDDRGHAHPTLHRDLPLVFGTAFEQCCVHGSDIHDGLRNPLSVVACDTQPCVGGPLHLDRGMMSHWMHRQRRILFPSGSSAIRQQRGSAERSSSSAVVFQSTAYAAWRFRPLQQGSA